MQVIGSSPESYDLLGCASRGRGYDRHLFASRLTGGTQRQIRRVTGQRDFKGRAPLSAVVGGDGAPMGVDNPSCDREADAKAMRLRRDEWREQLVDDIRRQPGSGV